MMRIALLLVTLAALASATPSFANGRVVTLLENAEVGAGMDLPPVDVRKFGRVFIHGFAPSGSASINVTFATEPGLFGDPIAKTTVGQCNITSISVSCSSAPFEGFIAGGPYLAIRVNPTGGTNIITLKLLLLLR